MTRHAIRKIVYCFGDASVPPAFHRSYRIVVTPDQVQAAVDSYGEVVAAGSYPMTRERFDAIVASLRANDIRHVSRRECDPGCTGGTSETIAYSDDEGEIFSGTVYHCGSADTGDLGGNTRAFAEDVRRLVPDLPSLLASEGSA